MPNNPVSVVDNPGAFIAHNMRVMQANGLSVKRIAVEYRTSVANVQAILRGETPDAKGKTLPKPSQITLDHAARAKALIAKYKAERRYASGRTISTALGLPINWLSSNAAEGRKNPHYAWALELMAEANELRQWGDPKMFRGNNTPLELRSNQR